MFQLPREEKNIRYFLLAVGCRSYVLHDAGKGEILNHVDSRFNRAGMTKMGKTQRPWIPAKGTQGIKTKTMDSRFNHAGMTVRGDGFLVRACGE
jgi:hypothetical protein